MRPGAVIRAAERTLSLLCALLMMPVLALCLEYAAEEKRIADGGFLSGEFRERKPLPEDAERGGAGEEAGAKPLDALKELNPDICAWLAVDGTHIDYPVVRGEDDSFYLSRNYAGEESVSGAIFLSCGNSADFSDSYSLIYGHHMDNGTMFGDVALFLDEEFLAAHPAGVLITGEGTRNIRFFACVRTSEDDRVVYSLTSGASELAARADILPGAHFPPAPGQDAQIIALSTCFGARAEERAVLFGVLERALPWADSAGEDEERR